MFRYRFLRAAAIALCIYGVVGLVLGGTTTFVGFATFQQIIAFQKAIEGQRGSLVQSLRTVSNTVRDTASATTDFQRSIQGGRTSADNASKLANDTAGTFRALADSMNLQVFGLQPLATVAPQFAQSADQLQRLAITLGATRDALSNNVDDVGRVGSDLTQLQRQLDSVAAVLDQPGLFGPTSLLPFQLVFYGMCLLVIVQSIFSFIAGIVLFRLRQATGPPQPFFPPALRTATTNGDVRDPVREW